MDDRRPQLALRQWRAHIVRPQVLAALGAVSAILAVAGPFETGEVLRLVPRGLYWAVIVVASYSCGFLVDASLRPRLARAPVWLKTLVMGLVTGLGVTLIVSAVNLAGLGFVPEAEDLVAFVLPILAISMIISVTAEVIARQDPAQQETPQEAPQASHQEPGADAPPILDRLPLDKRGTLVALSVEDHYVRVQTTRGEALLLMRLSDAIRETGATLGAQVHRSHWAAFDQVSAARREGDRAVLTMQSGAEIPVSRANLPKIKEAGLLPRS